MRVLATGSSGFLLRNALPDSGLDVREYKPERGVHGVKYILHFSGPSDCYDFQNKEAMAHSMIDRTVKMCTLCNKENAKMVFASSLGAVEMRDEYSVYKRALEQYIQATCPNHLILRIPRVYGADRQKGLMKRIREGNIRGEDWGNTIKFIDIEDFKVWFNSVLGEHGVQYYMGDYRTVTIQEIKEFYKL